MMKKPGKQTILYILCPSQSGSTLLSMLLGNQEGVACLGELNIFSQSDPHVDRLSTRLCSCRQVNWPKCEFWSLVNEKLIANFQISIDQLDIDASDNEIFCTHNSWLFETLSDLTGKSIVVDSSKTLSRMVKLQACGFQVIPIRLQRSPVGVVYSWISRNNQWEESNRSHKWWHVATYYNTFYREVDQVLKNKPAIDVSYEDMVKDPARVIHEIFDKLEISTHRIDLDWYNVEQHHLSGNPMRHDGHVEIKIDSRWKDGLNMSQKLGIVLLTFPALFGVKWIYQIGKIPTSVFHRTRRLLY